MEQILASLQQVLDVWRASEQSIPIEFSSYGVPFIRREHITKYLESQVKFLALCKEQNQYDSFDERFLSHSVNIPGNAPSLIGWIQNFQQNPNQHIQNIINTLDSWRANLQNRGLYRNGNPSFSDSEKNQLMELSSAVSNFSVEKQSFQKLTAEMGEMQTRALELTVSLERSVNVVKLKRDQTEELAKKIEVTSADFQDLHAKTEKTLGQLNHAIGNTDKLREDLVTRHSELEAAAIKATEHAESIESVLAAANRKGLASAFEARREALLRPLLIWGATFVGSIAGLCYIGISYVLPGLSNAQGNEVYIKLLYELPLTAPLIWLGYFSGSRYSYTEKVREDYAFKAATALSLEGFKKEAVQTDKQLLNDLLRLSIENFGSNPIRIYDKKPSEITPATQVLENENIKKVLEKLLDKVPDLDKIIDSIKKEKS